MTIDVVDVFGLRGKTVVVSGAASGMGRTATEFLIALGAEVHAVDLNDVDLPVTRAYRADLSRRDALDDLLAQLPPKIDAFYATQGVAAKRGGGNETFVLSVNYLSHVYLAEALAERIVDEGSITLISSAGDFGWEQDYSTLREFIDIRDYDATLAWVESHIDTLGDAYVFSKRALSAYVKSRVFDPRFIERRIRLNAISPGNTQTGLSEAFYRNASPNDDVDEGRAIVEGIFLAPWNGRWAQAHEMGYPFVAIGSKIFSYLSGQVIYIDHGLSSHWLTDALAGGAGGLSQEAT